LTIAAPGGVFDSDLGTSLVAEPGVIFGFGGLAPRVDVGALLPTGEFTIEFWSRFVDPIMTSVPAGSTREGGLAAQFDGSKQFDFGIGGVAGTSGVRIKPAGSFEGTVFSETGFDTTFGGFSRSSGLSHWVLRREVVVAPGDTEAFVELSVFRDGVWVDSSGSGVGDVVYDGSTIVFPTGLDVDEVAVYDKALSPTRISAHYEAGVCVPEPFGPGPGDPCLGLSSAVLADGPVMYWPFNATNPLVDAVSGLTIQAPSGFTRSSFATSVTAEPGVRFNSGGSRVEVEVGGLLPTGDLSVEFWARRPLERLGFAGNFQIGAEGPGGLRINPGFLGYTASASAGFAPGFGGFGNVFGGVSASSGLAQWVLTRDGNAVEVFRDGEPVPLSRIFGASGPMPYFSSRIVFPTGMVIDGLAIYDAALTAQQIATHYNQGRCETDTGPPPPTPVCEGLSLVECYAPEVRFHPDEDF